MEEVKEKLMEQDNKMNKKEEKGGGGEMKGTGKEDE